MIDSSSNDFLNDSLPIYTATRPGLVDVIGGVNRLLGDEGVALPVACPLAVRVQVTGLGRVVVLDESGLHPDEPRVLELHRAAGRGTGDLAGAVEQFLRVHPGFPFPDGLSVAVAHQIPPFSGILWREPLEGALTEALARIPGSFSAPSITADAGPGGTWVAIDTGYPAPPDSVHGEHVATAALMAFRLVADHAGLPVREVRRGLVSIEDPVWRGSPLNLPPSVWEGMFRHRIPESMTGEAFLDIYGGINDPRFRVERSQHYALRGSLHFVCNEAARARLMRALPPACWVGEALAPLGELLYHSHAQADVLGLSVEPANALVSMAMERGSARGIHGARLTGLGGGGTVVLLIEPGAQAEVDDLCREYEAEVGLTPHVIPSRE